ncbi:MAG: hypothetical protein LWY06_00740 [Firmicutes bacterium]|nr:hypothetical protein [Bacillota bacterium]
MTVTTSLGKKEFSVEPFEKKADIVRVYKGLPAVIKVTDNKKRILYQNIYDFDSVDSKRCESGKRNGRILTVNIPDDGILDKIFSPDSYKAIPSSDEKPEKGGVEKNSEKPQRYRNSDVSKIYTDQKRHEFYLIAHEDHTGLPSSRRTLFEKVSRTYHADRHPTSQNYWNRGQIGDRGNAHELRYGFI